MDTATLPILQEILSQLDTLTNEVRALAGRANKRRVDPAYIAIRDAAQLAGRTSKGVSRLLQRDAANPSGVHPRRLHGFIHRADFARLLESKSKRPRGAIIAEAVQNLL